MDKKNRRGKIFILLMIFLLSIIISFQIGRYPIGPVELVKILLSRIIDIPQTWPDQAETVVFNIRLPRVFLSFIIGSSLALSGLLLQQVFNNPMASQDVLGSSSASAFGASLALLSGAGYIAVSISAFLFGILSLLLIIGISSRIKKRDTLTLILCGIMVSSLFSSSTSFIKLVADTEDTLPAITYFLMGSLAGAGNDELRIVVLPMIASAIPLFLLSWKLNLLSLPEEEARSLGVNTKAIRAIAIAAASLMTASSVAVAGMIGWVGLVIPHVTRMLTGPDARWSIPSSMLLGSAFLTAVDTVARTASYQEIPIGILTSFIGAPFFLYLIIREGRRNEA